MATLTGRVRPQFTAPVPATASQPFADAAMDIDDHDQVPTYNAGVEVDVHQNNNTAAAALLLLLLHYCCCCTSPKEESTSQMQDAWKGICNCNLEAISQNADDTWIEKPRWDLY